MGLDIISYLMGRAAGGGSSSTLTLYDHGAEGVAWSVSGGSKAIDRISLNVGGGNFTNYAITDEAIDLSNYNSLSVTYIKNNEQYSDTFDISTYNNTCYISFRYLTDNTHNEGNIGLSLTKAPAGTFQLWSGTSATTSAALLALVLTG